MIDNIDKGKEIAYAIWQDLDLNQYTKDYLRVMMSFLELDESKILQKHVIAEKMVQIYQTYRGQYQMYLNQSKFKILNPQVRDIIWQLFKQYDEKLKQRKFMSLNQPKPMMSRQHMNQHMIPPPNQNMNMNMVNMFLQVPNFQSVQEIQMFQRRMFEIYKNFMPQVLNSISGQSRYYSNAPYQQYSMHNMNNMAGMNTMTNIPGMGNLGGMGGMPGINNMTAMSSMSGLSGMSSMGIPGLSSMGNMGSMGATGMSGMTGIVPGMSSMTSMNYPKTPDYYQPQSSYTSRSYFQNKNQNPYSEIQSQSMQNPQKNISGNNIYRPNSMIPQNLAGGSFNFYGNTGINDDYNRGAFKGMGYSQGRINSPPEQYERKNIYSQKFINPDDQKIDNPYSPYNQFPLFTERPILKNKQKEQRQNNQVVNSQPRKMIKKDDQVSLYNSDLQSSKQCQNISNVSNPASQTIQIIPPQQPPLSLNYTNCICSQKNSEDICYYCKVINIDPLNEVKQVLKVERISQQKTEFNFIINKKTLQKINQDPDKLDIQLRCIRMDKQSQIQVAWPQKTRLMIDEDFQEELTSPNNSKKKKDKPFLFSRNFGTQKNLQEKVKIVIQVKKPSEKTAVLDYLFGIFLVQRYTAQKMYDKIMQNITQTSIMQFFKTASNQKRQQIVLSIYDPTSKKLIKDPVRGKLCTHHQCFDLSVFISFLLLSPIRQWKCPICSKQAKALVLDTQVKKILNQPNKISKQLKQIVFYPNGTTNLRQNSQKQRQNEKIINNEMGYNEMKNNSDQFLNNQQKLKKQLKRLSYEPSKVQ